MSKKSQSSAVVPCKPKRLVTRCVAHGRIAGVQEALAGLACCNLHKQGKVCGPSLPIKEITTAPTASKTNQGDLKVLRLRHSNLMRHWLVVVLLTVSTNTGCRNLTLPSPGPPSPMGPDQQVEIIDDQLIEGQPVAGKPSALEVPRELSKVSLPPYVIEPPDILLIDAVKIVPKSPHTIETFDVLAIRVEGTLAEQPIAGTYSVDPEGKVDLGPAYGRVSVIDMTTDEAKSAMDRHLRKILQNPEVSVSLAASAGAQRIEGEHLVGPDGTVNLGTYGNVYVTGRTLPEARAAIEAQLSNFLEDPEVTVDVFAYNSKVYYVITEGAGFGDNVIRQPVTGNETVLDAVAAIGGLAQTSSTKLWISRPAPGGAGCEQVLPINWRDITRGASTDTNYQILPGDRLFIAEDKFVAFDSLVSKLTRPFERIFGFNILGTQMIARFNQLPLGFNSF